MEVKEVYLKDYKDMEYHEVMFESKLFFGSAYYEESHFKSNICCDSVDLLDNDVLVIRGYQLLIKEHEIGFSSINTMKVVKVNKDSFVIKVARGNIEIKNYYKKYFYLADGVKLCPYTENEINYRKRLESLA